MDNLPASPPLQTPNAPAPAPQPSSPSKAKWWIIVGSLLGVIIILFAFYSFRSTLFPTTTPVIQKPAPTSPSQDNSFFDSQSATVQGTITKITSSTVSITNDKGISGNLPISSKVLIYDYNNVTQKNQEGLPIASASSDLKKVEIGKKASLFLELIDGRYQVTSISYFPSLPTPTR